MGDVLGNPHPGRNAWKIPRIWSAGGYMNDFNGAVSKYPFPSTF